MFDPIKGPSNTAQGPATGDSTEHGDNWHTVVAKINAGFKHVLSVLEGGVSHVVEVIDAGAREELADLREQLAALQIKFDALTTVLSETRQPVANTDAPAKADPPPAAGPSEPLVTLPAEPQAAEPRQASLDAVAAALAPAQAEGQANT